MSQLIIFIVALALCFDFLNGFHDAANSVATVITTRVLSPMTAVFWAAFFNFAAAFAFGTGVASTISKGLIDAKSVDVWVVFGGLIGAIVWDIVTWIAALPTSSSHAIISGYAGAAIAKAGFKVILVKGWMKVFLFLLISPIIGFILAYFIMIVASRLAFRTKRHKAEGGFRHLQLVSAASYSLMHGTNDAQKTMGVIVALLLAAGKKDWTTGSTFLGHHWEIAAWIVLSCHLAMALGTASGGWRIVKTMGSRITPHLRPVGGMSAEFAAATSIAIATFAHTPISTTHAIGGSIAGVGSTRGLHSVRWLWARKIIWAWVLTFPCAAIIGAVAYFIAAHLLGPIFPQAAQAAP